MPATIFISSTAEWHLVLHPKDHKILRILFVHEKTLNLFISINLTQRAPETTALF